MLSLLLLLGGSVWYVGVEVPRLVSRELRSQLVSIIHLTVAEQEQGTLTQMTRLKEEMAQLRAEVARLRRSWWRR